MNLMKIIGNVDITKKANYINLEQIASEFDMHDLYEDPNNRIQRHYITKWLCTDTWVGTQVYFLDDKFVCISQQQARKSDIEFTWKSLKTFYKVKDYLSTLVQEQNDFEPKLLTEKELSDDLDTGFHVEYSGQFLTKVVICKKTGELVTIVDTFRSGLISKKLKIQYKNGNTKTVSTNEVLVPYCS